MMVMTWMMFSLMKGKIEEPVTVALHQRQTPVHLLLTLVGIPAELQAQALVGLGTGQVPRHPPPLVDQVLERSRIERTLRTQILDKTLKVMIFFFNSKVSLQKIIYSF